MYSSRMLEPRCSIHSWHIDHQQSEANSADILYDKKAVAYKQITPQESTMNTLQMLSIAPTNRLNIRKQAQLVQEHPTPFQPVNLIFVRRAVFNMKTPVRKCTKHDSINCFELYFARVTTSSSSTSVSVSFFLLSTLLRLRAP
jgi:hypothetical protein